MHIVKIHVSLSFALFTIFFTVLYVYPYVVTTSARAKGGGGVVSPRTFILINSYQDNCQRRGSNSWPSDMKAIVLSTPPWGTHKKSHYLGSSYFLLHLV